MFYQIFLSPKVKRWTIITYKHGIYKLTRKLHEISRKCLNSIEQQPSAYSPRKKEKLHQYQQKPPKNSNQAAVRYPTRKHEPAPSTPRTRKINQPPMTRRSTTPATIHQRKLQTHATEIFKAKNSLSPEVMTEAPEIKEPYCSLCSEASHYGIQFMRHLAPRIWNIVPQNIREPY